MITIIDPDTKTKIGGSFCDAQLPSANINPQQKVAIGANLAPTEANPSVEKREAL